MQRSASIKAGCVQGLAAKEDESCTRTIPAKAEVGAEAFKKKKRQHEKQAIEEIERCFSRKDARNFYQKIKQTCPSGKARAETCRDENGHIVVETQSMLKIWKNYFCNLLNGDDEQNSADLQNIPFHLDDDDQELRPPDLDDIEIAISRLKSNKAAGADGLSAELYKAAGHELVESMHQLISKIWSEESMPDKWNHSIICPIHKKGDPLNCANYRGISLQNTAYKIFSTALCERLKPFINNLIGPYQCGFRPGKSTIDQIFTLRQILEKTQEMQIDTHHLFVDFKAAFDSVNRDELYNTMSSFDIPAKLVKLCRMTLENSRCSVRVG